MGLSKREYWDVLSCCAVYDERSAKLEFRMFSEKFAAKLRDSDFRVVVTGGGGWLGLASLAVLENAFGEETSARVSVFGSRARALSLPSGRTMECRQLSDIKALSAGRYLFLHYAFITKGHVSEQPLAEYVCLNREIAEFVDASARRVTVEGFFLPSSGAVYRKDRTLHDKLEENPYGVTKLEDEKRFRNLSEEIDCRLMLVRVFNVAGPCVNNIPAFALSSIIMDVLCGKPVQLRASNPVYRSYVHVVDLIELVLSGLLSVSWKSREAFDTAGETTVEVGELARHIVETMGLPNYPIQRPAMRAEPIDRYVGDRAEFLKHAVSLAIDLKPLRVQIQDTVADLRERLSTSIPDARLS